MESVTALQSEIDRANAELAGDAERLARWALALPRKPVVTTSFGPFSAVVLDLATRIEPKVTVLWVDSGYGTPATYRYADELVSHLGLNLHIAHPQRSRAQRDAVDGPPPPIDDPRHGAFAREVKLEPFDRAMAELGAGTWITGLRAEETAHRASMLPVALNEAGIVKVAPLLRWTAKDMHQYLKRHGLPNNFDFFDPTKVEEKRECGLHLVR
jgi:phosphoadenosine phosphosulfate reductase